MLFNFSPETIAPFNTAKILLLHKAIIFEVSKESFRNWGILMASPKVENHATGASTGARMKHVGWKRKYSLKSVLIKHELFVTLNIR